MDKPPAAASAPAAPPAGVAPVNSPAALPPLEEWSSGHVLLWRDMLYAEHPNNKAKFSEFFDNLPKIADGSTLTSYSEEAVIRIFDNPKTGRAFGPELYARLQKRKQPAPPNSTPPPVKKVAITSVTTEVYGRILAEAGISVEEEVVSAAAKPVAVLFPWDEERYEAQQQADYARWLRGNLVLPREAVLSDCHAKRFFSLTIGGTQVTGTSDFVISIRRAAAATPPPAAASSPPQHARQPLDIELATNAVVLFEIKPPFRRVSGEVKPVDVLQEHSKQAVLELLAARKTSPRHPIVVLTDLSATWAIFYAQPDGSHVSVNYWCATAGQALQLVEDICKDRVRDAYGDKLPGIGIPIRDRDAPDPEFEQRMKRFKQAMPRFSSDVANLQSIREFLTQHEIESAVLSEVAANAEWLSMYA